MRLPESLQYRAKIDPSQLAIVLPGNGTETISFGQLGSLVGRIASTCGDPSQIRGQIVAMCLRNPALITPALCACLNLRAKSIIIGPPDRVSKTEADLYLYDHAPPIAPPGSFIELDFSALKKNAQETHRSEASSDEDTSLIFVEPQASGGETSYAIPASLYFSRVVHRQLLGSLESGGRVVHAADFHQERGLSALFQCLWSGGAVIFSNGRIEYDLQTAGLYRANSLFLASNWAETYLSALASDVNFTASLRSVSVSGAKFTKDISYQIKRHIAAEILLQLDDCQIGTYASCVQADVDQAPIFHARPGFEVKVVSREGVILPHGTNGHLAVKSPSAFEARQIAPLPARTMREGYILLGIPVTGIADNIFALR